MLTLYLEISEALRKLAECVGRIAIQFTLLRPSWKSSLLLCPRYSQLSVYGGRSC